MTMNNREKQGKSSCEMCGKCCHMEIPLTLLDIQRVAEFRGVDEREIFRDSVQERISARSSLFMIKKNHNGACIFLTDTKKCSIHTAKPSACQFYSCSLDVVGDLMPWTATCSDPSQRVKLWEQSVASVVTKAYIRNNGPSWNRPDYEKDYERGVELQSSIASGVST